MSQITVLTGPERRRRWRPEDKLRILAEAFSPGGCVGAVARRHDVSRGLIYTWRRKLRRELPQPVPAFAEAVLAEEPNQAPAPYVAIVVDPRRRPPCSTTRATGAASIRGRISLPGPAGQMTAPRQIRSSTQFTPCSAGAIHR